MQLARHFTSLQLYHCLLFRFISNFVARQVGSAGGGGASCIRLPVPAGPHPQPAALRAARRVRPAGPAPARPHSHLALPAHPGQPRHPASPKHQTRGAVTIVMVMSGKPSKKKLIFADFVRKREGGSRTKPIFYIRIIWDPTLREGGAKFLFPKSKLLKDLNKNWLSQT